MRNPNLRAAAPPPLKPTRSLLGAGLVLAMAATGAGAETVPLAEAAWSIDAAEWRFEEHLGRPSLKLRGGLALVGGVETRDGVLAFDIAFTGERTFVGGVWRVVDSRNYEQFYVRPHQSGNPDANQYTPVFHGLAGWQLYHGPGYGAPVAYDTKEWIHVEVAFAAERAEIRVGSEEPVLRVGELLRPLAAGGLGLSAGPQAPAWFSNVRYRREAPELGPAPPAPGPPPPGTVRRWSVSSSFPEALLEGRIELDPSLVEELDWSPLDAGRGGITNLARVQGADDGNTAFARIVVESDAARRQRVRFGYSDRVRVFANGDLLYAGTNDYRSRDYRYLGTIGLFDEVFVPLDEGRNELLFAVSESFGGWGILAEVPGPGVRLVEE